MSALLNKVESLANARQAERAEAYRQLVIEIANGGEPDPDEVVNTLEAAGKSPADLHSDLQTVARRRRLVADVQAGVDAAAERLIIPQQIADADAALAAAQQTHREAVIPLQQEMHRLLALEAAGRTAGTDLEKTAPESLKRELSLAISAREQATRRHGEANTAVIQATRKFDQHSQYVDQLAGVGPAVARIKGLRELSVERAELARLQAAKETAEGTLAEAQQALDRATAEEARIRGQLRIADIF